MANRPHYGHSITLIDHCTDLQSARFRDDGTLQVRKSVEFDVTKRDVWCDDCNVKLQVPRDKIEYNI